MSSTLALMLLCVLVSCAEALRSAREASISFSQHPVQTTVKVVLAGFDGDGSLGWRIDRTVFSKTLQQLCPQVVPHARDPHPVKALRVPFNITYSVTKTHGHNLDDALTSALMRAHQKNAYHDGVLVVDIDEQLRGVFAGVASTADGKGDFTILVTNPRPKASVGGFPTNVTYGYRYDGGAITQHWLGHERYVVLDYSAGPVQYGNAEDSDAVFSSYTFKALEKYYLDARIAAHVVAAVRQVWVPDVSHTKLTHADRNHQNWNSFEDKHLDVAVLKRELAKIKGPHQGVHHLHDHPRIALELAKAMRHDSVHEMDLKGLRGATDPLAEELLLPEADKAAYAAFFSKSAGALANSSVRIEGTHILPVYLFSIIDYAKNLLLDKEGLVHATSEAVIVLQSAETSQPLPYFQMKDTTYLDATMRHVIAGLATALGGLIGPDGYYSAMHHRIIADLTFANGHHPFGPFSNCTSLSTLQQDIYLRNLVISNIENAADSLTNAIVQINKFAEAFVGSFDDNDGSDNWIEFLYHRGEDITSPVAFTTVTRLHSELDKIYASLQDIVTLLSERKYLEAYQRSVGFGRQAQIFDGYIDSEIEQAELQLLCCQMTFEAPQAEEYEQATSSLDVLRWVLFLTLIVSVGTVYALRRFKPQRSRLVL